MLLSLCRTAEKRGEEKPAGEEKVEWWWCGMAFNIQQKRSRTIRRGVRRAAELAWSETPAPVGEVVLAELLYVFVAVVVVLVLMVVFPGPVVVWQNTC